MVGTLDDAVHNAFQPGAASDTKVSQLGGFFFMAGLIGVDAGGDGRRTSSPTTAKVITALNAIAVNTVISVFWFIVFSMYFLTIILSI